MLDKLTLEDFTPHLETTFRLELPDGDGVDLRLVEAVGTGGTEGHRQPFSLIFQGPAEPIFPQAIYRLHHERMGALGLFLVPLGPGKTGIRYESIFT